MSTTIYVGNLPYRLSEQELGDLFQEFGEVDNAKIITDRESGRSRGFGFVEMPNKEEASAAIDALNESDLGGRSIVVNEARPRRNDRRGGGGGGGRPRN